MSNSGLKLSKLEQPMRNVSRKTSQETLHIEQTRFFHMVRVDPLHRSMSDAICPRLLKKSKRKYYLRTLCADAIQRGIE